MLQQVVFCFIFGSVSGGSCMVSFEFYYLAK